MVLQDLLKKTFDIREGEFKVSLLMLGYVFLIITSLLIIKPTVNSLFLSELEVESLPIAFLIVAVVAYISSFFYSKALSRFSLRQVIESTLIITIAVMGGLTVLLKLNLLNAWMLYFFYVWVAIHAVLSASQFWVLANLVYNPREAKRLFGFIGSGAILGGIFGGYLTSILAPIIGNDNLFFLAIFFLFLCIPLLRLIWKLRVAKLNIFKVQKRTIKDSDRPFWLITQSKHLSYLAGIVGVSVLVAKLVDYQFSEFASAAIQDPDELTAFFAFWFSTFNLLSLAIQLFITHRVVGVWGVGSSMLILPLGILLGCLLFFIVPELSVIIFIKAVDGSLKQSINKSASELLALPLPFELKNKTKSFIDVVVDSVATGVAGFILIFVVSGLDLPSIYITGIIILLVLIWIYFVYKVRVEYFKTFRDDLALVLGTKKPAKKILLKGSSAINGMKKVFQSGTEEQLLFMLGKLKEINDKRFVKEVEQLLSHPSVKVRTAAIQNMYFLNNTSLVTEVPDLLASKDEELIIATLEYLLSHASSRRDVVFDQYLNHKDSSIANAALFCLAREARDNESLRRHYHLEERLSDKINQHVFSPTPKKYSPLLIRTLGAANLPVFYAVLEEHLDSEDPEVIPIAIEAAGLSMSPRFIPRLISFVTEKKLRPNALEALNFYGIGLLPLLAEMVHKRMIPLPHCRYVPLIMQHLPSQQTVEYLMSLLEDPDLAVRQETIRALSNLKVAFPEYKFDHLRVVKNILEECKMYHQTLSAMHTQIIISYRNRTKSRQMVTNEERDARASLLELLERRLDAGLERIFKLLGLKYGPKDINIAYEGILSNKQDAQTKAIEFLDSLLYGDLKKKLLPIIENTVLDITSEEVQQNLVQKVPSEYECFTILLNARDHKLRLAVLYLIGKQKNPKYLPLVEMMASNENDAIRAFATEILETFETAT
jgi:AAA family ATP:ADP antiporter